MVKTQIYMHWSVITQKIKIFRDVWVFILSPIPKNENLEITEIHQKPQNTEMWICNFKNVWYAVQKIRHQFQNHSATLLVIYDKDFPWFPGFCFEPYTQKRKFGNHKFYKKAIILKCENEIKLKIMWQIDAF